MSNFTFLSKIPEYRLFSTAAIEAEKVYATSPAMCAVGCRKALELAVKWVYSADNTITIPYRDNLHSLIDEPSFRFALDPQTWGKLKLEVKQVLERAETLKSNDHRNILGKGVLA